MYLIYSIIIPRAAHILKNKKNKAECLQMSDFVVAFLLSRDPTTTSKYINFSVKNDEMGGGDELAKLNVFTALILR